MLQRIEQRVELTRIVGRHVVELAAECGCELTQAWIPPCVTTRSLIARIAPGNAARGTALVTPTLSSRVFGHGGAGLRALKGPDAGMRAGLRSSYCSSFSSLGHFGRSDRWPNVLTELIFKESNSVERYSKTHYYVLTD